MNPQYPFSRIVFVDRMSDGILIKFEDGRYALYSDETLCQVFALATELFDEDPDDDDGTRREV